jgi:hypothetical protein
MDQDERDFIAYKAYVDLWAAENPIKTFKLQVLLAVNALLVFALQVGGGFRIANWPVFMTGWIFSAIWTVSIGRTSLFQMAWRIKATELSKKYMEDPRFQLLDTGAAERCAPRWLRLLGGVPSRYYLLGAPAVFSLVWVIGLIYTIFFQWSG